MYLGFVKVRYNPMPSSCRDIGDRRIDHDRPLAVTLVAWGFGVSPQTVHKWLRTEKLKDTRVSTVIRFACEHPNKLNRITIVVPKGDE